VTPAAVRFCSTVSSLPGRAGVALLLGCPGLCPGPACRSLHCFPLSRRRCLHAVALVALRIAAQGTRLPLGVLHRLGGRAATRRSVLLELHSVADLVGPFAQCGAATLELRVA
jgi:hypothetical protein